MVKTSSLIAALAALAGYNVMAQSSIPTSELGNLDPSVLSSAIAHAESTLSAMKTDPSFSSVLANPTYSSLLAQASSAAGSSSPSSSGSGNQSSGSSIHRPIGVAALTISAVAVIAFL